MDHPQSDYSTYSAEIGKPGVNAGARWASDAQIRPIFRDLPGLWA